MVAEPKAIFFQKLDVTNRDTSLFIMGGLPITMDAQTIRRVMPGMSCVGWIGQEQEHARLATFESAARDMRLDVRKVVLRTRAEGWQARLAARHRDRDSDR
jgi:hypothetical protein